MIGAHELMQFVEAAQPTAFSLFTYSMVLPHEKEISSERFDFHLRDYLGVDQRFQPFIVRNCPLCPVQRIASQHIYTCGKHRFQLHEELLRWYVRLAKQSGAVIDVCSAPVDKTGAHGLNRSDAIEIDPETLHENHIDVTTKDIDGQTLLSRVATLINVNNTSGISTDFPEIKLFINDMLGDEEKQKRVKYAPEENNYSGTSHGFATTLTGQLGPALRHQIRAICLKISERSHEQYSVVITRALHQLGFAMARRKYLNLQKYLSLYLKPDPQNPGRGISYVTDNGDLRVPTAPVHPTSFRSSLVLATGQSQTVQIPITTISTSLQDNLPSEFFFFINNGQVNGSNNNNNNSSSSNSSNLRRSVRIQATRLISEVPDGSFSSHKY